MLQMYPEDGPLIKAAYNICLGFQCLYKCGCFHLKSLGTELSREAFKPLDWRALVSCLDGTCHRSHLCLLLEKDRKTWSLLLTIQSFLTCHPALFLGLAYMNQHAVRIWDWWLVNDKSHDFLRQFFLTPAFPWWSLSQQKMAYVAYSRMLVMIWGNWLMAMWFL